MSKIYVHWLKIDGYAIGRAEYLQYNEIVKYLLKHPNAKAETYQYECDLFNCVVRLECHQNYDDLDMAVNSFSNNLRRLSQKPKRLLKQQPFFVPKRVMEAE